MNGELLPIERKKSLFTETKLIEIENCQICSCAESDSAFKTKSLCRIYGKKPNDFFKRKNPGFNKLRI